MIDIDVRVAIDPGSPRTWTEPGEPAETWIEQSIDAASGEDIELDVAEVAEAIKKAASAPGMYSEGNHNDEDSDGLRPF